jgi:hypothetical protein
MDLVDGGMVYARQSDRVVGVWRTGRAPVFVHVAGDATLLALAVWDDVPWLLVEDPSGGLALAPVR